MECRPHQVHINRETGSAALQVRRLSLMIHVIIFGCTMVCLCTARSGNTLNVSDIQFGWHFISYGVLFWPKRAALTYCTKCHIEASSWLFSDFSGVQLLRMAPLWPAYPSTSQWASKLRSALESTNREIYYLRFPFRCMRTFCYSLDAWRLPVPICLPNFISIAFAVAVLYTGSTSSNTVGTGSTSTDWIWVIHLIVIRAKMESKIQNTFSMHDYV